MDEVFVPRDLARPLPPIPRREYPDVPLKIGA
jgi:hypothetical protein